ncbi:unnamed protein product, partial [Didymodactylos carnosus]
DENQLILKHPAEETNSEMLSYWKELLPQRFHYKQIMFNGSTKVKESNGAVNAIMENLISLELV